MMTLAQAVGILNAHRHRGRDDWKVMCWRPAPRPGFAMTTFAPILVAAPGDHWAVEGDEFHLDEFAAAAIAAQYVRRDDLSPPASLRPVVEKLHIAGRMVLGGTIIVDGNFRV